MTHVIKQITFIAAIAMALGTAGCAKTLENAYYGISRTGEIITGGEKKLINYNECPAVVAVEELALIHQFPGNMASVEKNLKSRADIEIADQSCSYTSNSVTVDISVLFTGTLGPKGRLMNTDNPVYSYPYFVAITDRSGDIMAKQLFTASIHYANGSDEGAYTENMRQIIPIDDPDDAKDYAVMIGFQLSDMQLEYNRQTLKAEEIKARAEFTRQQELKRIIDQQKAEALETTEKQGDTMTEAPSQEPSPPAASASTPLDITAPTGNQ